MHLNSGINISRLTMRNNALESIFRVLFSKSFEVGDFCFLFKEFVPELNYLQTDNYEILLNLRALR